MGAHPDLVKRAAAAMTIEHLGCTEWIETADKGYHATGENEMFGVWTTQGKLFDVTRDALIEADLARTALLRPPAQFGVGGAFQTAGVPQIGAIAGPEYLLTITPNGDMDKLDERLAAKQIAWLADIAKRIDGFSAEELRAGDPTLGSSAPSSDESKPRACGPRDDDDSGLVVRFHGRRGKRDGVVVALAALGAASAGVTVELRRGGKLIARSKPVRVGKASKRLTLHRRHARRFGAGAYMLVVRHNGRVLSRRAVRLRPAS